MQRTEKNILIIGAGDAGRLLQQDIEANHRSYDILGFVDDKQRLGHANILGTVADCQKLASRFTINEMIIAIPSADGAVVRNILLANRANRIPIRIVPRNQRIIATSTVRYDEVVDVSAEDFLGRPFVNTNVDRLKQFYKDKTIFVTGGAGSIGSEIVRQLLDLGVKKVIVYDNSEYLVFMLEQYLRESGQRDRCDLVIGSILNTDKLNRLFQKIRPDMVFHAAAYKHVHLMEDNIDESIHNNVIGTKRVIDVAAANAIPQLTFISTDKVVNPTSVMGATKKLCEYYIHSLSDTAPKSTIVRFGNVINSNGSVLPLFERQIVLHKYVTVTHAKMERFFMSIREAAQLVIESTAAGSDNTIHVLNMGELINVYEVALCLIRSKNLVPDTDVEVRVTGLRKGEKLVEELYTSLEEQELTTTKDNRMYVLKKEAVCPFDIHKAISQLEAGMQNHDEHHALRTTMKELFPSLKLPSH